MTDAEELSLIDDYKQYNIYDSPASFLVPASLVRPPADGQIKNLPAYTWKVLQQDLGLQNKQ